MRKASYLSHGPRIALTLLLVANPMTDETRICSDCGYRNPRLQMYCIKCGHRLYDIQSLARWIPDQCGLLF